MNLRHVNTQDAKSMVNLIDQLGYKATEAELLKNIEIYSNNNSSWCFVIDVDGVPIASASYHLTPYFHAKGGGLRVTSLVVDANHKRKGFGEMLMNKASELAKEHGCDKIELSTGGHRAGEAHLFYESLGFKPYDGVRYLKKV